MRPVSFLLALSSAIAILGSASLSPSTEVSFSASKEKPLQNLSDYGFFEGKLTELRPAENVHPYALNTPLFSDYAHKARFVYIPEGERMEWRDVEVLNLPVGSVLIKHFYYLADERDSSSQRRYIETRLLKNTADKGWLAWPYVWNEEQSDARYKALGTKTDVAWIDAQGKTRELRYESPNQFECKSCHSYNGEIRPIGPTARQLHGGEVDYLMHWQKTALLQGAPVDTATWPVMDWQASTATAESAARAYLDANCGFCHRHEGPASTSGLFLHASYPTGPETGVRKSPVAAGKGSGGYKYDIYPGKPDKSILYYRMLHDDPAVRMPEVGRSVPHEEGLAVIKTWIATMSDE